MFECKYDVNLPVGVSQKKAFTISQGKVIIFQQLQWIDDERKFHRLLRWSDWTNFFFGKKMT